MSAVITGRHTADPTSQVTVFLIGMRFNDPWRVRSWWPVVTAMPRMLQHLEKHPEAGLLSHQAWFGRTTILLSYWADLESLQRFAADPDAPHLAPWRSFTRRTAGDSSVGIWHETYRLQAGAHESVYVNMPAFGLGAATSVIPVAPGLSTSKQRLAAGAATRDVS